MNWFKENPVLAGLCGAAVIILVAGGYLITTQIAGLAEQQSFYDSQVQELHKLQNQTPYPSQENLKQIQDTVAAYRRELIAFESKVRELQPPLPGNLTPQLFSDNLRKVVSAIEARAKENNVSLPENFYMGFNQYQTGLPTESATPFLQRKLNVLQAVMEKLIETKVGSINITRAQLAVENAQPAPPDKPDDKKTPEPSKVVLRTPLDLTLTGEQARVRQALNALLKSPQFLIVRALKVENSAKAAPAKGGEPSAEGSKAAATSDLDSLFGNSAAPGQTKKESLPVILGRESITATVRIELVDLSPLNLQ